MSKSLIRLSFLTIAFLSACGEAGTPNDLPTNGPINTEVTAVTQTMEPSPSVLGESLSTEQNVQAFPSPQEATSTAWPTLRPREREERILHLLAQNEECRLPCVWGIEPGKTEQHSAERILEALGLGLESLQNRHFAQELIDSKNLQLGIGFASGDDIVTVVWFSAGSTLRQDGYQVLDDPVFKSAVHEFTIGRIFTRYGPPAQILFEVVATAPEPEAIGHLPFYLILVYRDQGFLLMYEGEQTTKIGYLEICPSESTISLLAWNPGTGMTPESAVALGPSWDFGDLSTYPPIEEVTDFSPDTFYSAFSDAIEVPCFRVAREHLQ